MNEISTKLITLVLSRRPRTELTAAPHSSPRHPTLSKTTVPSSLPLLGIRAPLQWRSRCCPRATSSSPSPSSPPPSPTSSSPPFPTSPALPPTPTTSASSPSSSPSPSPSSPSPPPPASSRSSSSRPSSSLSRFHSSRPATSSSSDRSSSPSLPLLLLARAAGLLDAAFPASDLQQHALSVAALLLAAAAASLASALYPPRTAHHFLAETALACAGAVGGLWALQSGLSLYVDSCVPAGCHRLMDAAAAPATRCDVEQARLRAVAVMDLALSVHCVIVATIAAGVYLGVARWCGVHGGGGGAGVGMGRKHNGVGGSYDALPMVASAGAIAEMDGAFAVEGHRRQERGTGMR